jgi:peptide/nickel transport system substrate-binding protein
MIDKLFMGDGDLCGPVGPSWDTALPADEIKKAYTRDVTKAKQLLSAAGYENLGFKLACASYADNADRAAIIQQNLREAGIDVQIDAKELVSWYNDMLGVNYEANTYANLAYLSDDIQLQNHYSTSFNRSMYYGVDDAEVDAMLLQIQSTVDPAARKELAWEVQRKILERHGPVLTLYEPYSYWVAYDYIKNYQPSPWGFGMYKYDMWLDKA